MSTQRDLVRDFVFPLALADKLQDGYKVKAFLGTAFLIGDKGYCLTAAHVVKNQPTNNFVGVFVSDDNFWCRPFNGTRLPYRRRRSLFEVRARGLDIAFCH